jgi:dienelactone hydrolase
MRWHLRTLTHIQLTLCLLLLASLWPNLSAVAGQRFKEQKLSRLLMATIKTGQAITLNDASGEFLAIYTEASTPRSRGGVILLHDIDAHPDWPELISPLRTLLPDYGWNTLSLQMPLLSDHPNKKEYLALFAEANDRIAAGIKFYSGRGLYNMVLVGHSLGGAMGLYDLASDKRKGSKVIAFVGIAVYDHEQFDASLATHREMEGLDIPILDIFGSLDREIVLRSAELRQKQAIKSNLKKYQQLTINGADHFFTGLETNLIKRIRVWLNKQAPSMEIDVDAFKPQKNKKKRD